MSRRRIGKRPLRILLVLSIFFSAKKLASIVEAFVMLLRARYSVLSKWQQIKFISRGNFARAPLDIVAFSFFEHVNRVVKRIPIDSDKLKPK